MPKYGINLLLMTGKFDHESVELIYKVADMGFDGVEIPIFDPDTVDVEATKKALESTNLECTGCTIMSPERDIISDEPEIRETGKNYLTSCIEILAELGSDTFAGPFYSATGKLVGRPRTEEEWTLAVSITKDIAGFAEEHGVTLALEPLNRFETYFINTSTDAVEFVKDVDSPNVKIMLDTFHMNIEEKSFHDAIVGAGDLLYHFHSSENDRGTPGTGLVDWETVFKALDEIDYDRWIVMESFVPGIEEIAKAAAIWRQIAPSGDALANEGLAFIKKMGEEFIDSD